MSVPWNDAAAVECGITWLEREIAPAGDFGRRARQRERPYVPGQEAEARAYIGRVARVAADVTAERLAALCETIAACPDPGGAVARAAAGNVLMEADFFEITRFLDAVASVRNLAEHHGLEEIGLPPWQETLAAALRPGRTAERTFYLADAFDRALAEARGAETSARARYDGERSRLRARIATYAGVEDVRDGEFILMREHVPLPLPRELRVLRESATYYLCELALDEPALQALVTLEAAEIAVAEREDAVRVRLSEAVRVCAAGIEAAADALGRLDAFITRARFAQRHRACVPEIPDAPSLGFTDARFVPLAASLAERGHRYVPLSLELEGVGVLTGPNMGGKSGALRTCGFVAACVLWGVPVPATAARVALFDDVSWIGIGAQGDDSLLSSFGREVAQLRDFFGGAPQRALVLIDEFARTTSPREGRALLIATIERLRAEHAVGLVATHLSGIADDADAPHYAVVGLREIPQPADGAADLDAAIERIAQVMDYRVRRVRKGEAGGADALALADVLGLDAALLARARSIV